MQFCALVFSSRMRHSIYIGSIRIRAPKFLCFHTKHGTTGLSLLGSFLDDSRAVAIDVIQFAKTKQFCNLPETVSQHAIAIPFLDLIPAAERFRCGTDIRNKRPNRHRCPVRTSNEASLYVVGLVNTTTGNGSNRFRPISLVGDRIHLAHRDVTIRIRNGIVITIRVPMIAHVCRMRHRNAIRPRRVLGWMRYSAMLVRAPSPNRFHDDSAIPSSCSDCRRRSLFPPPLSSDSLLNFDNSSMTVALADSFTRDNEVQCPRRTCSLYPFARTSFKDSTIIVNSQHSGSFVSSMCVST